MSQHLLQDVLIFHVVKFLLQSDKAGIVIPAKFKGSIPVSLTLQKRGKGIFSFDTLLLFAEALKSGTVNSEVHGYVKAGTFIFTKTFRINEKRSLKFNRNK